MYRDWTLTQKPPGAAFKRVGLVTVGTRGVLQTLPQRFDSAGLHSPKYTTLFQHHKDGGAYEIRTRDLFNAIEARYQLRQRPSCIALRLPGNYT
jgi:hypothetical protein